MSETKNIPPGSYRLSRDVQNPRPDGRYVRDWRKVAWWSKDTRFVVEERRRGAYSREYLDSLRADVAERLRDNDRYTVVMMAGDPRAVIHTLGPNDEEQYAALASALVSSDESLDQFMTRIDCQDGFVEWLVEHGHVLRGDLETWWHRYQHGDDESPVAPPAIEEVGSVERDASAEGVCCPKCGGPTHRCKTGDCLHCDDDACGHVWVPPRDAGATWSDAAPTWPGLGED